jgi:putative (di)nucleoside polyphosphate hydrolase
VKRPDRYFRAGVGAVVLNARGRVLVLERSDVPGAWQFPQGGLEDGEEPLDAARREASEETGIPVDALRLLGQYPEPLAYELPEKAQSKRTGMGQVQYWFFFDTAADDVPLQQLPVGEFRAARWVSFDTAVEGAAEFRRHIYWRLRLFYRSRGKRRV